MKTRCVAALSLMLALLPSSAFAWGPTGHRVVGRIAERHLSEAAARRVAGILGSESLLLPLLSFDGGGALVDIADRDALYEVMEGH